MRGKTFVAVTGAFGVGALLGWAITADIYEKKMFDERAQYDKMILGKNQHIWALKEQIDQPPIEEDIEEAYDGQEVLEIDIPDEEDVTPGETEEETRTNLQKLIDMYTADNNAPANNMVETRLETERRTQPFVISRATYAWDEEGESYSKITLSYYPNDRVLLDDDDEPIEDIAQMVGWKCFNQFGGESEDPDVVFVRNRWMETDFEIIREENPLPLHVRYGMEKEEFRANKAAGLIKLRQEDE